MYFEWISCNFFDIPLHRSFLMENRFSPLYSAYYYQSSTSCFKVRSCYLRCNPIFICLFLQNHFHILYLYQQRMRPLYKNYFFHPASGTVCHIYFLFYGIAQNSVKRTYFRYSLGAATIQE